VDGHTHESAASWVPTAGVGAGLDVLAELLEAGARERSEYVIDARDTSESFFYNCRN